MLLLRLFQGAREYPDQNFSRFLIIMSNLSSLSNQFGELTVYRVEQMVLLPKTDFSLQVSISTVSAMINIDIWKIIQSYNHNNYNFFDCDWFKKLLFPTNSLVKLLSDSLLSDTLLSDSLLSDSSISQSHSKS